MTTDLAGLFIRVDVLRGETGGWGTVAVSSTPGLGDPAIVEILRAVADSLDENKEEVA